MLQSSPGGHGERCTATTRVAQRCQVSEGTGRASLAPGLWSAAARAAELSDAWAGEATRLEVPCSPSSWLVAGCWKYMQGGDRRVGDSRVQGSCHNLLMARGALSTAR